MIDRIKQLFHFGCRAVLRYPVLAIGGILSLMLGSGVNTTMFTVIRAAMIRPLPYPESERLVSVQASGGGVTMAEFQRCREIGGNFFASLAAYRSRGERHLRWKTTQAWVSDLMVTEDFLRTLKVGPALGREFNSAETPPGAPNVILLSEPIWRRLFASDPAVIGQVLTMDNQQYQVAGILPANFWFPDSFDVLTPLQFSGNLSDLGAETQVIARLGLNLPGGKFRTQLANLPRQRIPASGNHSDTRVLEIVPLQQSLVAGRRSTLLLLFASTTFVLLMSCANFATLILVNLSSREKEIAVRLALGTTKWQLGILFGCQIFIVVILGVSCGWLLARGLLKLFLAWLPFPLPVATTISMDTGVFLFAVSVIIVVAGLLSMLPVTYAGGCSISNVLNTGRTVSGENRKSKIRKLVVMIQVTLSTALLMVAGLVGRSLYNLHQQHLGFAPQGLLTFETPFASELIHDRKATLLFISAVKQSMKRIPGVEDVSAINVLPLTGRMNLPAQRMSRPDLSIGGMEIRIIEPNYFETMGIPLLQGRAFNDADSGTSVHVVIINETLKLQWWQNHNPLGDQVVIGKMRGVDIFKDIPRDVIGIACDTKTVTLQDPPRPTLYLPVTQAEILDIRELNWIVKSNLSLVRAAELKQVINSIHPEQRIQKIFTMEDVVASGTLDARFNALLFGLLAGVSWSLAVIGLYSLLSYIVTCRTREVAVRIALGAPKIVILSSFLREGLFLTVLGIILGTATALAAGRFMTNILYGVTSYNVVNTISISALSLTVGLLASLIPSYRTTRVNPGTVLRND